MLVSVSVFVYSAKGGKYENQTSKISLRAVSCLSLWPVLLLAQSSNLAENLTDCKNGWETCDRSRLSQSEPADVALSDHRRDVSNCRASFASCDHRS